MPKVYKGHVLAGDHHAFVENSGSLAGFTSKELNPRYDLRNHSPDGFCWGYGGSGPAQLALAILADCTTADLALRYYQQFKNDVIAKLDYDKAFLLTEDKVREVIVNYVLKEK